MSTIKQILTKKENNCSFIYKFQTLFKGIKIAIGVEIEHIAENAICHNT